MAKLETAGERDLEVGVAPPVASVPEPMLPLVLDVELRWVFIRKVYTLLSLQLLLTVAVGSVVVFVHPVKHMIGSTSAGIGIYAIVLLLTFLLLCPLWAYAKSHPFNLILLALFSLGIGFSVGFTCAFIDVAGRIILESVILTAAVVVSLTLYTFWAVRRGHDFSFLAPFLFAGFMILLVFILIQIIVPLGRISLMIYGALASILFCGYIIYDTDNLIKRYSYNDYIWASVCLYLDVINLFLSLLTLASASEY